jgi:hypothetical protein
MLQVGATGIEEEEEEEEEEGFVPHWSSLLAKRPILSHSLPKKILPDLPIPGVN